MKKEQNQITFRLFLALPGGVLRNLFEFLPVSLNFQHFFQQLRKVLNVQFTPLSCVTVIRFRVNLSPQAKAGSCDAHWRLCRSSMNSPALLFWTCSERKRFYWDCKSGFFFLKSRPAPITDLYLWPSSVSEELTDHGEVRPHHADGQVEHVCLWRRPKQNISLIRKKNNTENFDVCRITRTFNGPRFRVGAFSETWVCCCGAALKDGVSVLNGVGTFGPQDFHR